jgi:hypothetical protein
MLDVVDRLLEQVGDVRVMQGVDDGAPASLADDESEVAEEAQLVRDRRAFHLDGCGKLVDRAGTVAEAAEDTHPARSRQRLHCLRDLVRGRRIERRGCCVLGRAVGHAPRLAERVFRCSVIGSTPLVLFLRAVNRKLGMPIVVLWMTFAGLVLGFGTDFVLEAVGG